MAWKIKKIGISWYFFQKLGILRKIVKYWPNFQHFKKISFSNRTLGLETEIGNLNGTYFRVTLVLLGVGYFFWKISWRSFLMIFLTNSFACNLLTIASFRIGVPSIWLKQKVEKLSDYLLTYQICFSQSSYILKRNIKIWTNLPLDLICSK